MQEFDDARDGFGDRELVGVKFELRRQRRFVRVRDVAELLEFIGARLAIERLGIALRADLGRCIHVDLDELPVEHHLPNQRAVFAEWRNKGRNANDSGVRKSLATSPTLRRFSRRSCGEKVRSEQRPWRTLSPSRT